MQLTFAILLCAVLFLVAMAQGADAQSSVRPPANAVTNFEADPEGPSNALGDSSQSDYWRELRYGASGTVSSDTARGLLIQARGEDWRFIRTNYLTKYAGWVLLAVLGLLVLFFLIRGRIRIRGGRSGKTISRFSMTHRIAHWFMASVFILLALSGLIMLLGRSALVPLVGKEANAVLNSAALQGHNLFGPLFIIALIWIFIKFLRGNFFAFVDFKWIFTGGGLIGGHASSGHYNFGEKSWFWLVILVGLVMSVTGLLLEFPWLVEDFRFHQSATILHALGAIALIAVSFGHIYLGTVGMEGSIDSMLRGEVDENWAKEHHDLWYEEVTGKSAALSEDTQASKAAPGTDADDPSGDQE